jgi:hypothetical protein
VRKPNYRQQKKAREDAKKVRQAEKLVRRQTPEDGSVEGSLESAPPAEKLPSAP